jgi:hypothetical protein
MKVFQAYAEYKIKNVPGPHLLNKLHYEQYHVSPACAQKDIDHLQSVPSFNVLHSEILEFDVPDTLSIEGTLKESNDFEDIYVEDDDHMIFTIDTTIRNHFLGRKIKITVELVD